MHDTYSNFSFIFLLVIDVEITETATQFLTFLRTYLHSDLFACRYDTCYGSDP